MELDGGSPSSNSVTLFSCSSPLHAPALLLLSGNIAFGRVQFRRAQPLVYRDDSHRAIFCGSRQKTHSAANETRDPLLQDSRCARARSWRRWRGSVMGDDGGVLTAAREVEERRLRSPPTNNFAAGAQSSSVGWPEPNSRCCDVSELLAVLRTTAGQDAKSSAFGEKASSARYCAPNPVFARKQVNT